MPRQYSPSFASVRCICWRPTMEASEVSEFEAIKSVAGKLGLGRVSAPVAALGPDQCW
jgi:transposase